MKISPLEKTTMTHSLFSYHARVTKRLAPKIRIKGISSSRYSLETLKSGLVIPITYHRSKGPINNRKASPMKIKIGSRLSPKFSITDFPIRNAIKIKIRPNNKFGRLFFFLKKMRYRAKSIPCRSPALLRTINTTSKTFKSQRFDENRNI